MNLKDNPSYSWLYGPASATAPGSDVEVLTPERFIESKREFLNLINSGQREKDGTPSFSFLDRDEKYARSVLSGDLKFDKANAVLAKQRAAEMINHVKSARETIPKVFGRNRDTESSSSHFGFLSMQFLHLHYLRRELEILRIFLPLANAKMRSQRKIPNMSVEAQQDAEKMHQQWRKWADAAVIDKPVLKGNKSAIAEEIKGRHNIEHAIRTIRKYI